MPFASQMVNILCSMDIKLTDITFVANFELRLHLLEK